MEWEEFPEKIFGVIAEGRIATEFDDKETFLRAHLNNDAELLKKIIISEYFVNQVIA